MDDYFQSTGNKSRDYIYKERVRAIAMYERVIPQQKELIESVRRDENLELSENLDYFNIASLKAELAEKLHIAKPRNIAAASRIQGMTPACLVVLLRYAKNKEFSERKLKSNI